ncbi:MAG: hypothetical protein CMI79_06550 [Candidatus Pelagibacter sp.]|nr:hypothetical protein [Candidatus Pelagibacter sp.]|tara:strand:- start:1215 stop:1442 length:228 start_codon:yes stop_codon:yes gene_type:complete
MSIPNFQQLMKQQDKEKNELGPNIKVKITNTPSSGKLPRTKTKKRPVKKANRKTRTRKSKRNVRRSKNSVRRKKK